MKKLLPLIPAVALVVVALLLFSAQSPAKDQEFSIRNGIKFGMTVDGVKAIEGTPVNEDDDRLEYQVNIQGLEKTEITYIFLGGNLSGIAYIFGDNSNVPTTADFELIDNVLKEKYGEPENAEMDDPEAMAHKFTVKNGDGIVVISHSFYPSDIAFMRHMLIYAYMSEDDYATLLSDGPAAVFSEDPASSF